MQDGEKIKVSLSLVSDEGKKQVIEFPIKKVNNNIYFIGWKRCAPVDAPNWNSLSASTFAIYFGEIYSYFSKEMNGRKVISIVPVATSYSRDNPTTGVWVILEDK